MVIHAGDTVQVVLSKAADEFGGPSRLLSSDQVLVGLSASSRQFFGLFQLTDT